MNLTIDLTNAMDINSAMDINTKFTEPMTSQLLGKCIETNFCDGVDFVRKTINSKKWGGQNNKIYLLTKETANIVISAYNITSQNKSIGFIYNALKPLFPAMVCQHKVGKYFVDLYIPEMNLCVECDEEGEGEGEGRLTYNNAYDATRQSYIEKEITCILLRFNSSATGFDISNVIANILKMYKINLDSNELR